MLRVAKDLLPFLPKNQVLALMNINNATEDCIFILKKAVFILFSKSSIA